MRTTTDFDRTKINDPKAGCTNKGANKATDSVGNHDYPIREGQWNMFTEHYYEAMGGYIALMANENYTEYFDALLRCDTN